MHEHGTQDLLGQRRGGGPAGGATGREGHRGPGGGFAQEGRDGRPGRSGRQRRGDGGRGQRDAAASQSPPELLPRPIQPAVHRPGRAAEPLGGLGEREALEVAEHHRQPEGARQAVDLAVQRLGLLAIEHPPGLGGVIELLPAGGAFLLGPASPGEPCAGLAGGAQGDAVEPGPERIRVADRSGPSRQDEEDGLEGVLGMVVIAQELAADAEHHRPVAGHDGGEGGLVDRLAGRCDPLEQFAVGEPRGRTAREERPELTNQ